MPIMLTVLASDFHL